MNRLTRQTATSALRREVPGVLRVVVLLGTGYLVDPAILCQSLNHLLLHYHTTRWMEFFAYLLFLKRNPSQIFVSIALADPYVFQFLFSFITHL